MFDIFDLDCYYIVTVQITCGIELTCAARIEFETLLNYTIML